MTVPQVSTHLFRRANVWCAVFVLLLSLLSLVGWGFGIYRLASFRNTCIPMAPSTALSFLCIGLAILVGNFSLRWLQRALALAVPLIAATKIIEVVTGSHFGIDERLVADPAAFGAVSSGRMSPVVAVTFLLIGIGIWMVSDSRRAKGGGPLGTIAGAIGLLVLLGYIYGTPAGITHGI
jgi:hypothetical protein